MKTLSLHIGMTFCFFLSSFGQNLSGIGKKVDTNYPGVQETDSCSTHISINSKDGWWLNIENPVTNEEIIINQDSGTFKINIQECLGLLQLSRYKNEVLIERGMLKINSRVIADTVFLADKKGKVYPHPYPRRYAYKIGVWKYFKHDGTILKEEEY
jgi:hypothetical protein